MCGRGKRGGGGDIQVGTTADTHAVLYVWPEADEVVRVPLLMSKVSITFCCC